MFHPRSRLEESDSEIEAIEPEADGNFKEERSIMSEEEGDEEEEEEENYEGEGEEEESEEDEEEDEGPAKPVKQPCILVFDSLGGKKDRQARNNKFSHFCHQTSNFHCFHPQARLCQTLRDFLTMEWKEKHPDKPPRVFTPSNMPGSAPKVQLFGL